MLAKLIFVFVSIILAFFTVDKLTARARIDEGFVSGNCPTTMIKKGGKIMLYNPKMAKIPGVNPLVMDSLKDYKEYIRWQRASGLKCPILHLEKEFDAQGVEKYEIKRSFVGNDQTINVGALNHNLPIIQKPPKIELLLDAHTQNNAEFNQNQLPAYDPYNQNVGRMTKLDVNNESCGL